MQDRVVATYELDGEFDLDDAARVVAMEQSTGTWTKIGKRPGSLEEELAAEVVDTDAQAGTARIAFPLEILEPDNLPGLFAIVAGNLFGLGSLTRCRWIDVDFPDKFVAHYPGPRFGIDGIRRAVGTSGDGRPHVGTIVKPKVGLDPKQTAEVAAEAARGGLDLIKDDETLTDQAFCPLDERARRVLDALETVRDETGHTTLYAVNITSSAAEIVERWERVRDAGANCVMIDVLTSGFDALRRLRQACDVPIHVHRTMHGALTRSPDWGIDMRVLCRLTRLCGGDQLHIGSASGKMGRPERLDGLLEATRGEWRGLKPVLPVSSGGLHPASVAAEVAAFGSDVVLQAGGGIHGHPGGTRAGAHAMRRAAEVVHGGGRLEDDSDEALQAALEKWGEEDYSYGT